MLNISAFLFAALIFLFLFLSRKKENRDYDIENNLPEKPHGSLQNARK